MSEPRKKLPPTLRNALSAASLRNIPVKMPVFKLKDIPEPEERMCWGDYYRKHVYRREDYPEYKEKFSG